MEVINKSLLVDKILKKSQSIIQKVTDKAKSNLDAIVYGSISIGFIQLFSTMEIEKNIDVLPLVILSSGLVLSFNAFKDYKNLEDKKDGKVVTKIENDIIYGLGKWSALGFLLTSICDLYGVNLNEVQGLLNDPNLIDNIKVTMNSETVLKIVNTINESKEIGVPKSV